MAERAIDRLLEMDAASPKRIAVIGDALTDAWVYGYTADCQDGCQKFVKQRVVQTPGGAANAARSLTNWYSEVLLFAQHIRGTKSRFVANGSIVFRVDMDLMSVDCEEQRLAALAAVPDCHAVLLSDYDKGFLELSFLRRVIDAAAEHMIPCVADCKREPALYEGAVLKGNGDYSQKYNSSLHVVTHGACWPLVNGHSDPVQLLQVPCLNHVGAGDCFAAHLTLALAHGFALDEAARVAHLAGAVYVQHPHNRPPFPEEVQALTP